jgi:membrane associated rhomboid family serine protease
MVLEGWKPLGLIGHPFLHGGLLHLVFNMLYLWIFGNAVCEKIGSLAFAAVYFATGIFAGAVHTLLDGSPAIGASGAINGVVGFYLVLHPINRINCFYWWFFKAGTFDIAGFWLILLWFVMDAIGAFGGAGGQIAYWAHVGGFVSGFALGVMFLKLGWARMESYDNPTLLDYLADNRDRERLARPKPARPAAHSSGSGPAMKPLPARVPPARRSLDLDCPHCNRRLEVPVDVFGTVFVCPACAKEIELREG